MNQQQQTILVIGGAGYIGSHMALLLKEQGYQVIILDNLSTGHQAATLNLPLHVGDIADQQFVQHVLNSYKIDAVMHFASFIQVGESVLHPGKYYANNVASTIQLLNCLIAAKIKYLIFSSTAAVYGEPLYHPIDEEHPLSAINPYGHSKKMVEQILIDFANAYDFRYISLRYFNAAGADPVGRLKECHDPETHLIPLILQAVKGLNPVTVFGRNHDTPDGTCIRDYIHVMDLCHAHLLALKALMAGSESKVYNLGTGTGYSVQEVLNAAANVFSKMIPIIEGDKRPGDPKILVANPNRAMTELKWQPQYNLTAMIEHAAF